MKLYILKVMTSGADLEMEKSCWGGGGGGGEYTVKIAGRKGSCTCILCTPLDLPLDLTYKSWQVAS